MSGALSRQEIRLHGHPVSYYETGSGPVVLLVHGITSSADVWRRVIPALAEHHTVLAPDLLGHGGSAKPRGDYSLGAYASGLRDLLAALGHERATVVDAGAPTRFRESPRRAPAGVPALPAS